MSEYSSSPVGPLLLCEEEGPAHSYLIGGGKDPSILLHNAGDRDVIVISDLHLGSGLDRQGTYTGTENFFNDWAFARFLDAMSRNVGRRGATLVINGDFIDFIRITEVPESDEEFEEWSVILHDIGIDRSAAWLRDSIIPKEREYGLRTQDYKSVWRLYRSMTGHEAFFRALARWLSDGVNELVIVKGNHDLEWYWRAVRDGLRLGLARMIVTERGDDLDDVLAERVLPNLYFVDDAMLIDGQLYIEHGHRYDRYTYVLGEPAQIYDRKRNEMELNIPFGSFFNRYLLNRLEGIYPFVDNIRPRQNILPMLIRERFPLALSMIFRHMVFLVKMLKKEWRYVRFMFGRVFFLLIAILLPVGLIVAGVINTDLLSAPSGESTDPTSTPGRIMMAVFDGLRYLGGLILSYVLARLVAWLQLEEPDSLEGPARELLGRVGYRFATMGHTHNPNQFHMDGSRFYNTGTWIPIVESSSAELRQDRVYTFLHFTRDRETGHLNGHPLQCWNDSAGRGEHLTIVRKN